MHDPMTVAFEIRLPFKRKSRLFPEGLRREFITVWHVDPCTDGTDDSCGWSYPRLTKHQRSALEHLGWSEAQHPWFRRERAKEPASPADAESLMRGAIVAVAGCLGVKMSWDETCLLAARLTHGFGDSMRGSLCLLPGWHTNSQDDTEYWREEASKKLFCTLARVVLSLKRSWYRHPKFHVQHWHFQVHPLQTLKRWLFSRCAACGRRFPWGYSPVSHSWGGDGPRWFRGELEVYHHECSGVSVAGASIPEEVDSCDA